MVVKGKVGRRRYILFRIDSRAPISTGEMIGSIVHYSGKADIDRYRAKPWLMEFEERKERATHSYGIFRCTHWHQKEYTKLLNSIESILYKEVKIETIKCSGTIKTVREKLKELRAEEEEC